MIAQGLAAPGIAPLGASGGLRQQVEEAEDDEQRRQQDRQPEERSLDSAAAAIGGHLTTEGATEPGSALLEEDRGDQCDG